MALLLRVEGSTENGSVQVAVAARVTEERKSEFVDLFVLGAARPGKRGCLREQFTGFK